MPLALSILERSAPKVMLVEKPLCTPDLSQCDALADWRRAPARAS